MEREDKLYRVEKEPFGRIKYVGFDLDGTLFNTMHATPQVFGKVMSVKYGIDPEFAGRFFLENLGIATHLQVQTLYQMMKEDIIDIEEAKEIGETIDKGLRVIEPNVFPEVEEVLDRMSDIGYSMFVSSAHRLEVIDQKLSETNLSKHFMFLAGKSVEDEEYTKGEPHFRAAAEYYGVPYEEFTQSTAYVADATSDIEAAVKAGVVTIGRVGTFSSLDLFKKGATRAVYNFNHLPEILQRI